MNFIKQPTCRTQATNKKKTINCTRACIHRKKSAVLTFSLRHVLGIIIALSSSSTLPVAAAAAAAATATAPLSEQNMYRRYKASTVSTVEKILDHINVLQQRLEDDDDPSNQARCTSTGTTSIQQQNLPFVCVTYAQTLDGNIAISSNEHEHKEQEQEKKSSTSNLKLSSEDSFLLTHALRSQFDAILIGGKTLSLDNPRLNNRLWKPRTLLPSEEQDVNVNENVRDTSTVSKDNGNPMSMSMPSSSSSDQIILPNKQPIPVILDTSLRNVLRMVESDTFIKSAGSHEFIIVCCSQDAYYDDDENNKRIIQDYCNSHNNVVIKLLPCKTNDSSPGLDLRDVMYKLRSIHDIGSIMVEGGASILSACLSNCQLVDCVCVTVCPRVVGRSGLNALGTAEFRRNNNNEGGNGGHSEGCMLEFEESKWFLLGLDCIFLANCPTKLL